MTIRMTSRQKEVLGFILDYSKQHQRPPTYLEIATYFGFKSQNAAVCHVKALKKRGAITKQPLISRGIEVVAA